MRGQHIAGNSRRPQSGVALLIAIFVLMLVSVIAICLIVSAGTETALDSNYRSSANVYYAAVAGLEEARGRLLSKNPDYFNKTPANFIPTTGAPPLPVGVVRYITNPVGTEDVLTVYPDNEYATEGLPAPTDTKTLASVSGNNAQGIPGPLYKWVRITAATERSLQLHVDGLTTPYDSTTALYYDGSHLNLSQTGSQAFAITSLAVLPNGTKKLLQYVVAPAPISLPPLLAALTLSGTATSGAVFQPPNKSTTTQYAVTGAPFDCFAHSTTGASIPAIGVLTDTDKANAVTEINNIGNINKYTGISTAPDVENISASYPANLLLPSQLDALAQTVAQSADAVVPNGSNAAQTAYLTSLGMNASHPITVVANGDLDISNWSNDGYGLLLVTGTFTYDPDTNWFGIVLVIGQGRVRNLQNRQYKVINGAMFVAKTRDSSGNLLPDSGGLGAASVMFNPIMQGNGVEYSNCSILQAQPTGNFKVVSFRELQQQ